MDAFFADGNRGATPSDRTVLAAAIFVAGLFALPTGCRLAANHVKGQSPQTCAECHAEITRQWSTSAHATAWNDPQFVVATDDRQTQQCLPCHAPKPLLEQSPSEPPRLRESHRECGVDCAACHAAGCAYAGPYKSWGPHRMKQDATRLPSAAFCGNCHTVEHEEYQAFYRRSLNLSQPAKQCADCHMPLATSRLTQGHVLSLAHPKRTVHDHSFPAWTDEVLRGAVVIGDFHVRRSDRGFEVRFTLTNRGAGHRIPTGQFGHREMRILVELLGSDGAVLGQEEQSLLAGSPESLVPGEARPFAITAALTRQSEPASVRVLVERVDQDRRFRRTLASCQWPIDSAPVPVSESNRR